MTCVADFGSGLIRGGKRSFERNPADSDSLHLDEHAACQRLEVTRLQNWRLSARLLRNSIAILFAFELILASNTQPVATAEFVSATSEPESEPAVSTPAVNATEPAIDPANGVSAVTTAEPAASNTISQGVQYASGKRRHRAATRSAVLAKNGIVATSHPLAAVAGLDMLKAGGNAVDAAIAANAVLGVVEPMSCGIGGDLFAIYWDASTQKLYGLNASGRSPFAINRDLMRQRGLNKLPTFGPLSWSTPGCVDGWEMLRARFGKLPLAQSLQPAIDHAEQGFPVSEVIAGYWKGAEPGLSKWPDSARTFLPNGRAPRVGELFRNPNLAATLRSIATNGRDAFYRGAIAREIVAFSQANEGLFELKDFEAHRSNWVNPVSTQYRGYDVWELPPNGQGIAALEMLNILETEDLSKLGPFDAAYQHLLVEAKKLAFADRAKFYADPDFGSAPIQQLISKAYAAKQRARIKPDAALIDIPAGDPGYAHADTVYLTVVDKDRNCCSLIQSNYFGFGSQMTAGNTGFALQNRGALFSMDETHLNRLEPHKRPFHTIIPAMVTKSGKPWLCFGVMGGDMQPQGHVQILVNLIDFGMDVQQAGDTPRMQHLGSASPWDEAPQPNGGTVSYESGFPSEMLDKLKALGHKVQTGTRNGGGYQAVLIDHENGVLHGASESRKDGCAIGY